MDVTGRRLFSVFPFGKVARGRWSVARGSVDGRTFSLVFSGPLGSRTLALDRLGADGWQDIGLSGLESMQLQGSTGRPAAAGERSFIPWPN
jgi:hypothetical protein